MDSIDEDSSLLDASLGGNEEIKEAHVSPSNK